MNPHISDLFFAHDKERACKYDGEDFVGYDDTVLHEIAEEFWDVMSALGVDCPDPNELIIDFKERL